MTARVMWPVIQTRGIKAGVFCELLTLNLGIVCHFIRISSSLIVDVRHDDWDLLRLEMLINDAGTLGSYLGGKSKEKQRTVAQCKATWMKTKSTGYNSSHDQFCFVRLAFQSSHVRDRGPRVMAESSHFLNGRGTASRVLAQGVHGRIHRGTTA